jgi:hypothetical protein
MREIDVRTDGHVDIAVSVMRSHNELRTMKVWRRKKEKTNGCCGNDYETNNKPIWLPRYWGTIFKWTAAQNISSLNSRRPLPPAVRLVACPPGARPALLNIPFEYTALALTGVCFIAPQVLRRCSASLNCWYTAMVSNPQSLYLFVLFISVCRTQI